MRYEGQMSVGGWSEEDVWVLDEHRKVTRVEHTWSLEGELAGSAEARLTITYAPEAVSFEGVEWIDTRRGSVVVRTRGEFVDGAARARWETLPGMCTGEWSGWRASGGYEARGHDPARYWLG
jgi:hypothetical protein